MAILRTHDVLGALRAKRQVAPSSTFTHETYSRTDINLENWGLPLLLALAEITESKEQEIGIDEIKLSMFRYAKGLDVESISNSLIGYALGRLGFIEKLHVSDGQRYNTERKRVLKGRGILSSTFCAIYCSFRRDVFFHPLLASKAMATKTMATTKTRRVNGFAQSLFGRGNLDSEIEYETKPCSRHS